MFSSLSFLFNFNPLLGTSIYGLAVFTFINMLFGFVDVTGRPQIFKKYKIQDTKNFPVRTKIGIF